MAHMARRFSDVFGRQGNNRQNNKRALLFYQPGPNVIEILRQIPENGNDDDFDKAVELLNAYYEPQNHRLYDVYQFRQAKQGDSETLDQIIYATTNTVETL